MKEVCIVRPCGREVYNHKRQVCVRHYLQVMQLGEVMVVKNDPHIYIVDGDRTLIALGRSFKPLNWLIVDTKDLAHVLKRHWYLSVQGYVVSSNNGKRIQLSHYLMPNAVLYENEVDHIHGVKLDYRRSQLRYVTRSENCFNRKMFSNNTSGQRGVHLLRGKWIARLWKDGKTILDKSFATKEEAIEARKNAEEKLIPHIIFR